MELARAWTAFGGASLSLMGVCLGAGARKLARENLMWRREWRQAVGAPGTDEGEGASLALLYRAAGALIGAAGLGVLSASAAGTALVAAPSRPALAGALIAAVGTAAAALKAASLPAAGRPVEGLPPDAPRPFDERASDAAVWALCALWTAFGLLLLRGAFR
ncbi:MAG: hypothetical protein HY079_09820 [Elusimicrobia bacterium]|nr:hypothetical protein [Elusimicrobiota bacterium]